MPIYAYRCGACGHAQDVLQKISDPVLTECPQCHQSTFTKQVTAAGFQLKGSGWYVTDFRGGSGGGSSAASSTPTTGTGTGAGDGASSSTAAPSSDGGGTTSAASGGCGSSCACH